LHFRTIFLCAAESTPNYTPRQSGTVFYRLVTFTDPAPQRRAPYARRIVGSRTAAQSQRGESWSVLSSGTGWLSDSLVIGRDRSGVVSFGRRIGINCVAAPSPGARGRQRYAAAEARKQAARNCLADGTSSLDEHYGGILPRRHGSLDAITNFTGLVVATSADHGFRRPIVTGDELAVCLMRIGNDLNQFVLVDAGFFRAGSASKRGQRNITHPDPERTPLPGRWHQTDE
jgi:hypothetical protein